MSRPRTTIACMIIIVSITAAIALIDGFFQETLAKSNLRDAFFAVYPGAVGTAIETVTSQPNHCGVCHFDFTGGGQRNPYGVRLGR